MKEKIDAIITKHHAYHCSYPEIHVVDWKNFTNENLKVHDSIPINPKTGQPIYSVCLGNRSMLPVLVDAFGENALTYNQKKNRSKQCECVIYPDNYKETDWVLFIEMKYVKDETVAFSTENEYPNNTIEQIKQTVRFFKKNGILPADKEVYAIVSFPNLLLPFNSTIFGIDVITNLRLDENIIIRGTNRAEIDSSTDIRLIG